MMPRYSMVDTLSLPDGGDPEAFERLAWRLLSDQLAAGLTTFGAASDGSATRNWRCFHPQTAPPRSRSEAIDAPPMCTVADSTWRQLHTAGRDLLLLPGRGDPSGFAAALISSCRRHTSEGRLTTLAAGASGLPGARSWLAARQRGAEPVGIVGALQALRRLIDYLERHRLRFRLPARSLLLAVTKPQDLSRAGRSVVDGSAAHLGLSSDCQRLLVSFPGLRSPLLARPVAEDPTWRLEHLPWTSLAVLDETGREIPRGRLAMLDLATRDRPAYQWLGVDASRSANGIRLQPSDREPAAAQRPQRLPPGS